MKPLVIVALTAALLTSYQPTSMARTCALEGSQEMKVGRLMKTCSRCHMDVFEEWQASAHSRSWTDERFQTAIAEREDKGEACAVCHAPDSLLRTGPGSLPHARTLDRELGVNCITCHMDGRKYAGPIPSEAHGGVEVREAYRQAFWCASCHGQPDAAPHPEHYSSYSEGPAAKDERTCQDCHMPAVERQLAKARKPLKDLQPAQPCRKHDFAPALDEEGNLRGAATLTATWSDGVLAVTVRPHGGHDLALGSGRELVLEVQYQSDSEDSPGSVRVVLSKADAPAPCADVALEASVPVPSGATPAELTLSLVSGAEDEEPMILARESVPRGQ